MLAWLLFLEGSVQYLDSGVFDLGVILDANDYDAGQ